MKDIFFIDFKISLIFQQVIIQYNYILSIPY